MPHILFIGKVNQTNSIICDLLESRFDAKITFNNSEQVFAGSLFTFKKEIDLIIIDLNTSSGFGYASDKIRKLTRSVDKKPILVLHCYERFKFIQPLIEAGAQGVISNTPTEDELSQAVNNLLDGKSFFLNPEK